MGTKVNVKKDERFSLHRIVERECRIKERGCVTVVISLSAAINDEVESIRATIRMSRTTTHEAYNACCLLLAHPPKCT